MKVREIMFSINDYDRDGDTVKEGIFLHFGGTRVLASESIEDFRTIISHFEAMLEEIETNYPEVK